MTTFYTYPEPTLINLHTCIDHFTMERFRELMGVPPNATPTVRTSNEKVIEPAVLEVNKLSDLHVDIEFKRKHAQAPVHEVVVVWRKQEGEEFRASMQDGDRSKVGRKARLRGKVEAITVS